MRRRIVIATALLGGLALCGVFVQQGQAQPLTAGTAMHSLAQSVTVPAPSHAEITVKSVSGSVQRRAANGSWHQVRVGDVLTADDLIRTGADSSAQLHLGDNVVIGVAEETDMAVSQVSDSLSRVRLDDGRLATVVHDAAEDFRLRVEVRGTDIRAESQDGEFGVQKRGDGPVSVMSKRGSVDVSADGKHVVVGENEQTLIEAGKPPREPSAIPGTLFLKLARVAVRPGQERAELDGRTVPGASINVDGAPATVTPSGRFDHSVVVREGSNVILVEVVDALGRRMRREVPLITLRQRDEDKLDASVKW